LHEENVYYGDMREANLLVFRDYSVKIGNFGFSMKLDDNSSPDDKLYKLKGTNQDYTK